MTSKERVAQIERTLAGFIEDYPGQRREYVRQEAIRLAVQLADEVILEASDGTCEETDYLTAKVMAEFANKVLARCQSMLLLANLESTRRVLAGGKTGGKAGL